MTFGDLRLKEFYRYKLEGILQGFTPLSNSIKLKKMEVDPFPYLIEALSIRKDTGLDPNLNLTEPDFEYARFEWLKKQKEFMVSRGMLKFLLQTLSPHHLHSRFDSQIIDSYLCIARA